tara:strand:- start:228 stop:524 length:297 start_codon:yes stop_codon:yes gene_type:complete
MIKITGKIKDLKFDKKWFYIYLDEHKFISEINDGSVDVLIYTFNNEEVGIKYIEKNDIITIFAKKNNNNYFKNFLKPIKIYLKTKYIFLSETSEDKFE